MKNLKAYWFGGIAMTIGIVTGEDEVTGEHKAYISTVYGGDEKMDTQFVADHGSPVLVEMLEPIVKYLKG